MKHTLIKFIPGLALCLLMTLLSYGLEALECYFFQRAWLETLVIAILLGSALRTLCRLDQCLDAGIGLGAKMLLEMAIVLLGGSVSAAAILENGASLIAGIACLVAIAILASYALGRAFGLPEKIAILIACGNSICGNSAIAAVAPVIAADSNDVAASIAFTAVLGVVVVLILPLMIPLLSLSNLQYGFFAGLTVYAVPQVLAATSAVSLISTHIGTLVKLVRVLMLGPVVVVVALLMKQPGGKRPPLSHMVPWFIVGFLLMMAARSLDLVPHVLIAPARITGNFLTIMSMAALGLGVDIRSVAQAGTKVASVVILSLSSLFVMSFFFIRLSGIH